MKHEYKQVIIVGSGITGMCAGALLAKGGSQVTILERHPQMLGGHARTLDVGGIPFCAGPQFLWNFSPRDPHSSYRILKYLNPQADLEFGEFDPSCQDRVYIGERQPLDIPRGLENYHRVAVEYFPSEVAGLDLFFDCIHNLFLCAELLHDQGLYLRGRWSMLSAFLSSRQLPWKRKRLVLSLFDKRLSDLFDLCGLSGTARRFLYAQSGIFAENADTLSIGVYASAVGYCSRGLSYPRGGLPSILDLLIETIISAGGQVHLGKEVTAIRLNRATVESVVCSDGSTHPGDLVISTLSPRKTCRLVPGCQEGSYTYEPSQSLVSTFLTIAGYPALQNLAGRNFWWQSEDEPVDYSHPDMTLPPTMMYIGSQTANGFVRADRPSLDGLTIYSPGNFSQAAKALARDEKDHARLRDIILNQILTSLEKHIFPGIRPHVVEHQVLTPCDLYMELDAENGNVYGRRLDVRNVLRGIRPIRGVNNLEIACATIGLPGLETCFQTAALLVERLTGVKV